MSATKVIVKHNGPIRIEGDFELLDGDGKPYGLGGRASIGLCRCGHSANKPFCDGAHNKALFKDQACARELPPPKA